jgi:hypothetical protein
VVHGAGAVRGHGHCFLRADTARVNSRRSSPACRETRTRGRWPPVHQAHEKGLRTTDMPISGRIADKRRGAHLTSGNKANSRADRAPFPRRSRGPEGHAHGGVGGEVDPCYVCMW